MPVHQLIEQRENIAKRRFFSFVSFRSGLKEDVSKLVTPAKELIKAVEKLIT